jgi:lambda repressor-like predicted transcriptional regulator
MSADSLDAQLVAGIKSAMKLGKVSMRALSERTGLPYRSLQNYLSGTTKMPASAYVLICENLGIDNQYVLEGNFQLRYHPLWDALFRVLGNGLLSAQFEAIDYSEPYDMDSHRLRQRRADDLARKISSAYDLERKETLKLSYGTMPLTADQQEPRCEVPNSGSQSLSGSDD